MTALLLLVVCLLLGVAVARFAAPPLGLAQSLNWWVLNVALPALILHLMPTLHLDWSLWFLPAAMALVFLGGWGFFTVVGRQLHWSREQIGCLTLVCGLGNTSFVGYPLIEALRGHHDLALAVVADQLGSFPGLAIGGSIIAAIYTGQRASPRLIARKVLLFPPFIAFVAGVVAGRIGDWPAAVDSILAQLGATLVPLALFSVGLQLRLRLAPGQMSAAAIGLGWKLLLAAALVTAAGTGLGIDTHIRDIAVLQAAMAPMITASILATQSRLDPPLANTVLSIGILISLLSVPALNLLLHGM